MQRPTFAAMRNMAAEVGTSFETVKAIFERGYVPRYEKARQAYNGLIDAGHLTASKIEVVRAKRAPSRLTIIRTHVAALSRLLPPGAAVHLDALTTMATAASTTEAA